MKSRFRFILGYGVLIFLGICEGSIFIKKPSFFNIFPFIFIFLMFYILLWVETYNMLVNELKVEKYISRLKRIFKFLLTKESKNIILINLFTAYLFLNSEKDFLSYIDIIEITKKTPKKVKYVYYYNLAAYKLSINEKGEARKIFDENIKKEESLLGILLNYENNPEQKIVKLEKLLLKQKVELSKIEVKFYLGEVYEQIGNLKKARRFYNEIAEKKSDIYFVKVAKEKVLELSLKNKEM